MKPSDLTASWDASARTLRLGIHIHDLTLRPADFCDAVYEKKGDTLLLRIAASMTRYRFEGWEKNAADETYAAIKAYIEAGQQALLA